MSISAELVSITDFVLWQQPRSVKVRRSLHPKACSCTLFQIVSLKQTRTCTAQVPGSWEALKSRASGGRLQSPKAGHALTGKRFRRNASSRCVDQTHKSLSAHRHCATEGVGRCRRRPRCTCRGASEMPRRGCWRKPLLASSSKVWTASVSGLKAGKYLPAGSCYCHNTAQPVRRVVPCAKLFSGGPAGSVYGCRCARICDVLV